MMSPTPAADDQKFGGGGTRASIRQYGTLGKGPALRPKQGSFGLFETVLFCLQTQQVKDYRLLL